MNVIVATFMRTSNGTQARSIGTAASVGERTARELKGQPNNSTSPRDAR